MSDRNDSGIESRVDSLERAVAALERRVEELGESERRGQAPISRSDVEDAERFAAKSEPVPFAKPEPVPRAAKSGSDPDFSDSARRPTIRFGGGDPGQWVNRLGIALLLLGAAFGFKYSMDRGWIGPAMRVLAGLSLGAVLLALSGSIRTRRPGLSRVLAGGGIASGYLSIYAAFQLYQLVPYPLAFASMCAVTLGAFALAVRDDDAMMATIAAIGGLATPFVLYSGGRDVVGLVVYTCLVVAGAAAIFARSGWRVLLWTTAIGGWMVLGSASYQVHDSGGSGAIAVQAGILFLALATWWVAVVRELLVEEAPALWRPSRFGFGDDMAAAAGGDWTMQTHQLAVATPLLVLFLSTWTWKLDEDAEGWTAMLLAGGWAVAALHLRTVGSELSRRLASTHLVGTAMMLAFAMVFLLGSDARRIGLAAEGVAMIVLSHRAGDRRAAMLAHVLLLAVGFESYGKLMEGLGTITPRFGPDELSTLAVLAALAVASRYASPVAAMRYLAAAQAGLLLWLLSVLDPLPNGRVLVTASWFANAVVLLVVGLRTHSALVRRTGAVVMALTMGKLFVYDLATVDAVWRIATFLGFGLVLLLLGYAFPALWGNPRETDQGDVTSS